VTAATPPLAPTVGPTLASTLFPRTRVVAIALVIGGALLTTVCAQLKFYLPGNPVPVSMQTFAVLLAGATLGSRLGALSQGLYFLMGLVGLPVFVEGTNGRGGWEAATGSTFGYLVGFIVAAGVVGWLAERRQDRNVVTSIQAMLAGTVIILTLGTVWLASFLDISMQRAIELGVAPFLIGDLLKLVVAGLALPASWALVNKLRD